MKEFEHKTKDKDLKIQIWERKPRTKIRNERIREQKSRIKIQNEHIREQKQRIRIRNETLQLTVFKTLHITVQVKTTIYRYYGTYIRTQTNNGIYFKV